MKTPRTLFLLFAVMFAGSLFADPPCVLSPGVMAAFDEGATFKTYQTTIVAVEDFITACGSGKVEEPSRALFFDVVAHELTPERDPVIHGLIEPFKTEGPSESVHSFHWRLRQFMDKVVTSDDQRYTDVILASGGGKAIAALGPAVRSQVFKALGPPVKFYGYGQFSTQLSAFEAIGYWIDPAEKRFTKQDKTSFTRMLTGLVEAVGTAPQASRYTDQQLRTVLDALSHSDDPAVEAELRAFAARGGAGGRLGASEALKSADKIHANATKTSAAR